MYAKALIGAVAAGAALVAGLVLIPGEQSDPGPGVNVAPAGFCVLGTHGGKRGGCRGGSVAHELDEEGYTVGTATVCGGAGLVVGRANPAAGFATGVGCAVLADSGTAE